MKYEFDPNKDAINRAKHGIGFDSADDFEWGSSISEQDTRKDYGEDRFNAVGYIKGRLHSITYTKRGEAIRIISLRKASRKEVNDYESEEG